jgi:hypothetical protein
MTANDLTFIDPPRLRDYFWSLVALNDDLAPRTQATVKVELFLPPDLAEKVDAAIQRRGSCSLTRQHFLLSTLLWALVNIEEDDRATKMGLDIGE